MRLALPIAALLLASCGEQMTAEEKAAADAAAVAEVRATQAAPPETLVLEAIGYPDIERHDLYGAGCSFVPDGGGLGGVVLAMADNGYIKMDGDILTFAADKGSRELPYLARQKYDGSSYSFRLDILEDEGEQVGTETSEFDARLSVRDRKDRVVYEAEGYAQCGA